MPDDYHRGSGRYEDGEPVKPERYTQVVRNMVWPQRDKDGFHARGREYADRPADQHVQVEVRVELEHDGEVWIPGRASRWHGQNVFVVTADPRVMMPGVWVLAKDVRRIYAD